MRVLCARSLRGASSRWRKGASRIKKSLPTVRFVFLLRTIDMSANASKGFRERLSHRRRFPRLRAPTAEKACRPLMFRLSLLEVSYRGEDFDPAIRLWDKEPTTGQFVSGWRRQP